MPMIREIVEPSPSGVPRSSAANSLPEAPAGLSPSTLELWLAAARYRRLADELAGADARRLKP